MDRPQYIDWLIEEKDVLINGKHKVQTYRINYTKDPKVLDDFALHIRKNYIKDSELEKGAKVTGMTVEQYLREYVIPQKNEKLGPTARSADIAEIIVSDLLEYIKRYKVPRCKMMNRSGKNNSEHGTDIIGYKFYNKDKTKDENDELIAVEVKAKLTSEDYDPLIEAIDHSKKDMYRLALTLEYYRKKLENECKDNESSQEIARFSMKPENNYKIVYGAAGLNSKNEVEKSITLNNKGEELIISDGQQIYFIHGQKLMDLTHEIYERCKR